MHNIHVGIERPKIKNLPNLNSGFFLRGTSLRAAGRLQEDQIQGHSHTIQNFVGESTLDGAHSHGGRTQASSGSMLVNDRMDTKIDPSSFLLVSSPRNIDKTRIHNFAQDGQAIELDKSHSHRITHTHEMGGIVSGVNGVNGSPRVGDETRPKNISICWMIRIM